MKISFFEEFPEKKNLDKLKLIKSPIKLYLAAKSLKEFLGFKKKIKKQYPRKVKEFIYWPLLETKEGYWISPFSHRRALKRIFEELNGKKVPVMLDLELPTTRNSSLYVLQFIYFLENKRQIKNFIKNYKSPVYLAEYYPSGKTKLNFMKLIGLHYSNKNNRRPSDNKRVKNNKVNVIKMMYHSMMPVTDKFFKKIIKTGKKNLKDNYIVGFGTIVHGILGIEPVLSPKKLKGDLNVAKEVGVKEAVIFRLGGLNEKYVSTINKFK